MGEKTKGRKRHIVVDVMGNLLAVIVHAANIHDTKSGLSVAELAYKRYLSIKKFCADAGYRGTFVQEVLEKLSLGVDISEKIKPHEWMNGRNCRGGGLLNEHSLGSIIPGVSVKIMKSPHLRKPPWSYSHISIPYLDGYKYNSL